MYFQNFSGGLSALKPILIPAVNLLDGCSAEDIGARLSISAKTVQNSHYQIKSKLGVRSDIELTRLALRLGLI